MWLSFDQLDYGLRLTQRELAGQRLAVHERGTGDPPLVLVHGLGSDMRVWSENLAPLAARHRVVAVDLAGFGRSAKPTRAAALRDHVACVRALVDELGGRAVLVGHSMGGQIALRLAIDHPERVAALVLSAPAGLEPFTAAEGAWIRRFVDDGYTLRASPVEVALRHAQMYHRVPRGAWPLLRDRIAVSHGPQIHLYARAVTGCVAGMLDEPVFAELERVHAPTLVCFGRHDALIPNRLLHGKDTRALASAAIARMRTAELVMLDDAGHMPQLECPRVWNQHVLAFLARACG